MKVITEQQQTLLDSQQTLNLYLETLFRSEVKDQDASIEQQQKPDLVKNMDVMLLSFNGHKLALPVKDLKTVTRLDDLTLTRMPEQPEHMIGVVTLHGKNIPLFDINWSFNSRNELAKPKQIHDEYENKQLVVLNDERMAFLCEQSEEIINVNHNDIRWNKSRTRNRWLQGIIIEEMACLLDVRQIKRLFRSKIPVAKNQQNSVAA